MRMEGVDGLKKILIQNLKSLVLMFKRVVRGRQRGDLLGDEIFPPWHHTCRREIPLLGTLWPTMAARVNFVARRPLLTLLHLSQLPLLFFLSFVFSPSPCFPLFKALSLSPRYFLYKVTVSWKEERKIFVISISRHLRFYPSINS